MKSWPGIAVKLQLDEFSGKDSYPDMLVSYEMEPRIAIELKWNRGRISTKGRRSLDASIAELKVDKAYFITTLIDKEYKTVVKNECEENRLEEMTIPLGLSGKELGKWKKVRKQLKRRSRDSVTDEAS